MSNLKIDPNIVPNLDISARSKYEKNLQPIFPNHKEESKALYDFVNPNDPEDRLEIKKQVAAQWFDPSKFHNLSESDKKINVIFLKHEKGKIKKIFSIQLGDMFDIFCSDPKIGWSLEYVKHYADGKEKFPELKTQTKVSVNMNTFYKKYEKQVVTLY